MLFVESRFFVFLTLVLLVHWGLPAGRARRVWLLICSHFFYACFFWGDLGLFFSKIRVGAWAELPVGWWFPAVLIGSTTADYVVGRALGGARNLGARRGLLVGSLLANLGVLGFFKYYNFVVSSASAFLTWLGLPASDWTLSIFLPYGISFYTFQSMSYSVDVYRGRIEPVRNFWDLAFFIAFFPQLVAGPIVRAAEFLPQLLRPRAWSEVPVRACAGLFLVGFFKKACISENLAPVVDAVFSQPTKYGVPSIWIGVLFYAVQIYCDFSGYSDMAIATARLLGFELTTNFDTPYFSPNITEFWRRWHMSLSTWLRDYLYIGLGGSRGSVWFTYRNLLLTMLLGGLWHGASWNFAAWGGLHGVALVAHREWKRRADQIPRFLREVACCFAVPITFLWVAITWVPFRASAVVDMATGAVLLSKAAVTEAVLKAVLLFQSSGRANLGPACVVFFVVVVTLHWMQWKGLLQAHLQRLPDWVQSFVFGAAVAIVVALRPVVYRPFIYFQF